MKVSRTLDNVAANIRELKTALSQQCLGASGRKLDEACKLLEHLRAELHAEASGENAKGNTKGLTSLEELLLQRHDGNATPTTNGAAPNPELPEVHFVNPVHEVFGGTLQMAGDEPLERRREYWSHNLAMVLQEEGIISSNCKVFLEPSTPTEPFCLSPSVIRLIEQEPEIYQLKSFPHGLPQQQSRWPCCDDDDDDNDDNSCNSNSSNNSNSSSTEFYNNNNNNSGPNNNSEPNNINKNNHSGIYGLASLIGDRCWQGGDSKTSVTANGYWNSCCPPSPAATTAILNQPHIVAMQPLHLSRQDPFAEPDCSDLYGSTLPNSLATCCNNNNNNNNNNININHTLHAWPPESIGSGGL